MKYFYYGFGYETPKQHRDNARSGWDDEDSMGVVIVSPTEEEALTWGDEVAEFLVAQLFAAAGQTGFSWQEVGYASWVEDCDATRLAKLEGHVPRVALGELPDASWLLRRE